MSARVLKNERERTSRGQGSTAQPSALQETVVIGGPPLLRVAKMQERISSTLAQMHTCLEASCKDIQGAPQELEARLASHTTGDDCFDRSSRAAEIPSKDGGHAEETAAPDSADAGGGAGHW